MPWSFCSTGNETTITPIQSPDPTTDILDVENATTVQPATTTQSPSTTKQLNVVTTMRNTSGANISVVVTTPGFIRSPATTKQSNGTLTVSSATTDTSPDSMTSTPTKKGTLTVSPYMSTTDTSPDATSTPTKKGTLTTVLPSISTTDTSLDTTSTPAMKVPFQKLTLKIKDIRARNISLSWYRNLFTDYRVILSYQSFSRNFTRIISDRRALNDTYILTGLTPYTSYNITVYETFESEAGPHSDMLKVMTLEAAPSKPRNLQYAAYGRDYISIEWEVPEYLNGVITGYSITHLHDEEGEIKQIVKEINIKDEENVTRSFKITPLYPFVEYTILVAEKTVDYGPAEEIVVKTQSSKPVGFPKYLNVSVNLMTAIVKWSPIPSYERGGNKTDYELRLKEYKECDEHIKIDMRRKYLESPQNYTYPFKILRRKKYEISIRAGNENGLGPVSEKEFHTYGKFPSKPCNVELSTGREGEHPNYSFFLEVTWQKPLVMEEPIDKVEIAFEKLSDCSGRRCRRALTGLSPIVRNFNGERKYRIDGLDAYSKYSVKVREKTKAGWGEYSSENELETEAGVPSKPLDLSSDIVETSIKVHWRQPLYPRGELEYYNILIQQNKPFKDLKTRSIDASGLNMSYKFTDLEAGNAYTIKINAVNTDGIHGFYNDPFSVALAAKSTRWLYILIACLVVVLIIVIVLSIYLLLSRRRNYKEVSGKEDMELKNAAKSKVIPLSNFKTYCVEQHANSDQGFQQEYESLRLPQRQFTWEYSAMSCNLVKNRYSNIVAYDHSRVVLTAIEDDPSSTYINGNYIDGYLREKQYIATQGPLPETVIDFWRMIWDYNCPAIVMLTKLVEDNRIKCEQYWPEGKAMQYKDIVVTNTSIRELTDLTLKTFKLSKINNPELGSREVRHFHYTAWPDHGVPSHPTSMVSFIRHVMSYESQYTDGPIVVHCSAGVGRTGTFIAIEGCLRQMENDNQVDVFGTVLRMRMQRNFMVQTEGQYSFIYDALFDYAICGNTEIAPANLVGKIKYLNKVDPSIGQAHFVGEFKRLETGFSHKEKNEFSDASHPENKSKNRLLNVLPYNKNRVRLKTVAGNRQADYINASVIDSYQQKHAFIATQAPLENTVVDFWRMVLEQNVRIIVMLTQLEEKGQEKCYLYWPQAGTVSYGSVHVDVVNVRDQHDYVLIHDLRLTNRETGHTWPVTHYLYLGWPEYGGSPENGTDLIHFIGLIEKTQRSAANANAGPTLVHCSGGVGRTGVFITVFNSIERLKAKNVVDIFQTTRALRLQRAAMVQTIDQYKFCYQCLKDYLDSFDLYANPEC